jgi:hypothetical protein
MLDRGRRIVPQRRATNKQRASPRVDKSMKNVEFLLPVVKRTAMRHGIEVYWADHGKHVWFNQDGRRLLDYWPTTGTARANGINRRLRGVASALELARELSKHRHE